MQEYYGLLTDDSLDHTSKSILFPKYVHLYVSAVSSSAPYIHIMSRVQLKFATSRNLKFLLHLATMWIESP